METILTSPNVSTLAQTNINRNSYMHLAVKVNRAADHLCKDAEALAVLLVAKSVRPLCKRESKRLESLYKRMDEREQALSNYLAPAC